MEPSLAWSLAWGDSWAWSWGPLHEVYDPKRGGMAPKAKFYPLKDAVAKPQGTGAQAHTGQVFVESRSVTLVSVRPVRAFAGSARVSAQTACCVAGRGAGAQATAGRVTVATVAHATPSRHSARGAAGRVAPYTETVVSLAGKVAISGGCSSVFCDTVKDLADEELILWYLRARSIDMLTSKRV